MNAFGASAALLVVVLCLGACTPDAARLPTGDSIRDAFEEVVQVDRQLRKSGHDPRQHAMGTIAPMSNSIAWGSYNNHYYLSAKAKEILGHHRSREVLRELARSTDPDAAAMARVLLEIDADETKECSGVFCWRGISQDVFLVHYGPRVSE